MAGDPVGGFLGLNVRGKPRETSASFPRVRTLLNSTPLDPAVTLGQLLHMLEEPEMHEPFDQCDGVAVKHLSVRSHNEDMLLVDVTGLDPSFTVDDYPRLAR